jgi:hypothetical protein
MIPVSAPREANNEAHCSREPPAKSANFTPRKNPGTVRTAIPNKRKKNSMLIGDPENKRRKQMAAFA